MITIKTSTSKRERLSITAELGPYLTFQLPGGKKKNHSRCLMTLPTCDADALVLRMLLHHCQEARGTPELFERKSQSPLKTSPDLTQHLP